MTNVYLNRQRKEIARRAKSAKTNAHNKDMVVPIKKVTSTGVYSVYIEIIAHGDSEEEVKGVVEDDLDDVFGAENYRTYDIHELTEDEVIELDTGINDIEEMDSVYADRVADELG